MSITSRNFGLYVLTCAALLLGMPLVSEAGYSQATYYAQSGYYSQSAYSITISTSTTFTGSVIESGNFTVTGTIGKGGGNFVIDHPLDPKNKLLYHSFVESPDVKNMYDGIAKLDAKGEAVVILPSYFMALNKDFRYQLKPIGSSMPDLFVKEGIRNNRFTIAGGTARGKVSWQVTGIRHDPYILANPIVVEVNKGPDALILRGEMVFEDHPARGFPTLPLMEYIRGLLAR